jgi:tetratricopeptide (TPR) repeat protein
LSPIKRLIHEVHRRSLWQVVAIYLVGSFGALEAVDFLTQNAGLPDWVPSLALVLLVIGLPIVTATAFIQEGLPGREVDRTGPSSPSPTGAVDPMAAVNRAAGAVAVPEPVFGEATPPVNLAAGTGSLDRKSTRPPLYKRVITWRFALMGGVAACALLGLAVAGYFAMRVTGIGPAASLQAQGLFDERETIVLADFRNISTDSTLSAVVTGALRVDLVQSPVLRVLDPSDVAATLQRMELPTDVALTADVAREIAAREGFKAILSGEVGSLGSGYVVTATLRGATDGRSLAAFRVTAKDDSELVDAVDKLSQDIREKAGESLRSIKADPPLSRVTTSSLDALRKYAEADVLFNRGRYVSALALLEETVAADSGFAMAWRKIGVILGNGGTNKRREIEAVTRAYEHRDRLTEYERYQAIAYYNFAVTGDDDEAIRAYRSVLAIEPEDHAALNNLARIYFDQDRYAEAEELLRVRVDSGTAASVEYGNLEETLIMQDRLDEARATLAEHRARFPDPWTGVWNESLIELRAGNVEAADAAARVLINPGFNASARAFGHQYLAYIDILYGYLRDARAHWAELSDARAEDDAAAGVVGAALDLSVHAVAAGIERADAARIETLMSEYDWPSIDPIARPYPDAVRAFAQAGERARVEQLIAEWERDVPAEIRGADYDPQRLASLAVLDLVEGNAAVAVQEIEDSRRGFRCTRCLRTELAMAYEALDRTDDAIATWRSIVEERSHAEDDPFEFPLALERLGQLYDAQGDIDNAIALYNRFAELWSNADPELQPRVERAKNRVAALVAERG